ncbi:MAG TPA: DUF3568 family protein [Planctomycetota bacterium]|nr:DUF3568 family protein [Planctomycetota bacterium]
MQNVRKHLVSACVLIAATLVSASGCTTAGVLLAAGAAAGAVTVAYVEGDLETHLDASPVQIAAATEKAFEDLELTRLESDVTELDGRIEAESSEGKSVVVQLESLEDGRTKISIRVGHFGDEGLSRQVLERIREHLGA